MGACFSRPTGPGPSPTCRRCPGLSLSRFTRTIVIHVTDPFAELNAALPDHYVIDRELGRGGMALVYLARDTRHERFVALKTVRPEIAIALGRERFLREIKLAARLQHPNILPVYDSGDAGGTLYYVMPFVEGESLRDRLDREPQLPIDDALQIAREVAEALAYAHDHDVVHRDIKPGNIMLSGGHAIVADFGIARAVSAAGGDQLTQTGLAIGTPAYMPPEQASGSGQVDRRSDIYSLACVLYETLAGQPPFTGPTAQAIMARHSLDAVPRLKIVRDAIPDDLDVVSRSGVAPFRGRDIPRDSVARALAAGTLVEGDVENRGNRVRVTVRLVDGPSGADIRRQSFELPAGAQLAMRDSLARQAALFLRERLGDEIRLREERAATTSEAAWTLVQRAERTRKEGEADTSGAAYNQADSLLAAAERADPQWAEPTLQRGQLTMRRARQTFRDKPTAARWVNLGLGFANRVLARDPNQAQGLELRGSLRYIGWFLNNQPDAASRAALLDSAQADLAAAVHVHPRLASAHAALSSLLYQRKEVVSAVLEARQAYENDAYLRDAENIIDRLFWGTYDIAQFGEAQRWCREGARHFPASWRFAECQLWLMTIPNADLDIDRAWRLARQADSLTPAAQVPFRSRMRQIVVASVIGKAGRHDSAMAVLGRARTDDPKIDPTQDLVGYEAVMRALIGDADTAITILQRYVATHPDHSFRRDGMLHWWWRDLEGRPGFQAVLTSSH